MCNMFINRFLGKLKSYVRNNARPEGCIAEAYTSDNCLTFYSMYLFMIETKFNRDERNYDGGKEMNYNGLFVFSRSIRLFEA